MSKTYKFDDGKNKMWIEEEALVLLRELKNEDDAKKATEFFNSKPKLNRKQKRALKNKK
jgi:hypothetical protein